MFDGAKLFQLKATHGLPLEVAVERILRDEEIPIRWETFVEEARANGWYDFQTMEVIDQALVDSGVSREYRSGVMYRFKLYVLSNPICGVDNEAH